MFISKQKQNLEINLIPLPFSWITEKHPPKKLAIMGNDTLIYGFLSFTEAEEFINKFLN